MASLQSIPRFILPRGALLRPQARPLPLLPFASTLRYASSSAKPKTLSEQFRRRQTPVIPQPDKYRPPSHGKRTPRSETSQRSYGPALTEEDKKRMRTKKYPNMMSPEGSFSHWFFHNKALHLWITMVGAEPIHIRLEYASLLREVCFSPRTSLLCEVRFTSI